MARARSDYHTCRPAGQCPFLEYLQSQDIPFKRIDLETAEGQALMQRYEMRASPGILVSGVSINPYDLLLQPQCKVNPEAAENILLAPG
jgi:hypothetical protein